MLHRLEHTLKQLIELSLSLSIYLSVSQPPELSGMFTIASSVDTEKALTRAGIFCQVHPSFENRILLNIGGPLILFISLIVWCAIRLRCKILWLPQWNKRKAKLTVLHGILIAQFLMFAPLLQSSLLLFQYRLLADETRIASDLTLKQGSQEWWGKVPWACLGISFCLAILAFQSLAVAWVLRFRGIDWMFDGTQGFSWLGPLYGHSKRNTRAIFFFVVRYLKRSAAIIAVTVGDLPPGVRATLLLLVLLVYVCCLYSILP